MIRTNGNQASHYVDLLDWLIGPVQQVQAMVSTTRDIEVEIAKSSARRFR